MRFRVKEPVQTVVGSAPVLVGAETGRASDEYTRASTVFSCLIFAHYTRSPLK